VDIGIEWSMECFNYEDLSILEIESISQSKYYWIPCLAALAPEFGFMWSRIL